MNEKVFEATPSSIFFLKSLCSAEEKPNFEIEPTMLKKNWTKKFNKQILQRTERVGEKERERERRESENVWESVTHAWESVSGRERMKKEGETGRGGGS